MTKGVETLLLAALLLCLPVRPARAGFVSTADLQHACMSGKRDLINGCLQYIAGVVDYHILLQSFGTQPTIDFCLPDNITIEDAGVAVMAYLKSHPMHDALAAAVVPMALNEAYPCRPRPAKKTHGATRRRH